MAEPGAKVIPELEAPVAALRALISAIPDSEIDRFRRLRKIDEGAEAEAYYDPASGLVIKLMFKSPNVGRIGDGFVPAEVSETRTTLPGPVFLVDFLERHALNNEQGGIVLTEVLGITPSGRIVVVQQYIFGALQTDAAHLKASGKEETRAARQAMLKELGLAAIGNDTAVGWAGDAAVIADDLHESNLVRNGKGAPFVIDCTTRALSAKELSNPRIKKALILAKAKS